MRIRSDGFSLIELMVALALGLLLLSGVLAMFLSSRATYETTDRLSRVQDNGRFALDSIVRDVRSAGYLGCSRRGPLTVTLGSPDKLQWNFSQALVGYDAQGSIWVPEIDKPVLATQYDTGPKAGTDVLVVHTLRGDFVEPVRALEGSLMSTTTDAIQTEDTAAKLLRAGDIVQISDCYARSIFQVQANTAGVITYGEVAPSTGKNLPGNATADLGNAYTDTAELVALQSVVYYVSKASAPDGGTSLWRRNSASGDPDDIGAPEELVEGVEDLQFLFGMPDGSKLVYRRADQVTNWSQVKTVSIALLVRSTSPYGTDLDKTDYTLLDKTITAPGDRYVRQVFTTTISIRNESA